MQPCTNCSGGGHANVGHPCAAPVQGHTVPCNVLNCKVCLLKSMLSIKNTCIICANTTCTEPFAKSAGAWVSKLEGSYRITKITLYLITQHNHQTENKAISPTRSQGGGGLAPTRIHSLHGAYSLYYKPHHDDAAEFPIYVLQDS